jgi:hypothetical protein
VLADVRRGTWQPDEPPAEAPPTMPTFHGFASEWFERHKVGLRPRTRKDYYWALTQQDFPRWAVLGSNQ